MRSSTLFARLTMIVGVQFASGLAYAQGDAASGPPPDPWPRVVNLADAQVLVYQPQVSQWTDNQLTFRAALAIKATGAKAESFGVIFASTRTQVDKVLRAVVFEDMRISKIDFPTLPDRGAAYGAELQTQFAQTDTHHLARPPRRFPCACRHQAAARRGAEQPALGHRELCAGDSGAGRRRAGNADDAVESAVPAGHQHPRIDTAERDRAAPVHPCLPRLARIELDHRSVDPVIQPALRHQSRSRRRSPAPARLTC